jgi:hypothetical protein
MISRLRTVTDNGCRDQLVKEHSENSAHPVSYKNNCKIATSVAGFCKPPAAPAIEDEKENATPTRVLPQTATFSKSPAILAFKELELSAIDRGILVDLLRVFIGVAEKHNWTYFLSGGSLIGSVRHHQIIPWDDDIDITINSSHAREIKEVFKMLEPKYQVVDRGYDPILKLFSHRSHKCIEEDCKWRWPFLDLCFFNENATHIWDNHPLFSPLKNRKADVFPLHFRPFEGMMVKSPKNALRWIDVYSGVSDSCETSPYRHDTETGGHDTVNIQCENLKDVYPFVLRRWTGDKMLESLRLGNKTIQTCLLDEPEWTVTKPYSTVPLKGDII